MREASILRYKEISGKEIVDVTHGTRLGVLGQIDIEINRKTGKIESLIIPSYKWFGLMKNEAETKIHWESIVKIGEHMILVEQK